MEPSNNPQLLSNQNKDKNGQKILRRMESTPQLKSKIPKPVPYIRVTRETRSKSCSSCFKGSTPSTSTLKAVKNRSLSQSPALTEHDQAKNKNLQSQNYSTNKTTRNQYSHVKARIDNRTPVSLLIKNDAYSKDCLMHCKRPLHDINNTSSTVATCEVKVVDKCKLEANNFVVNCKSSVSVLDNDKSEEDNQTVDKISINSSITVEKADESLSNKKEERSLQMSEQNDSFIANTKSEECSSEDRDRENYQTCDKINNELVDGNMNSKLLVNGVGKENTFVHYRSTLMLEDPPGDRMLNIIEKENSCDSALNLHAPDGDVSISKRKYFFSQANETKNYLLKECAPEFLSFFAKQVEEVMELWLQLIYDMVEIKMTIGRSASPQISLHNPMLNLRDMIVNFFQNLPTQGEILYGKLCTIENEQINILRVVVQNIVVLIKELDELKRKHSQLEESYKESQAQLNEELTILGQENKELDVKCTLAVEKYELEKLKTEELEEHQVEILKELIETRKVIKNVEGKCTELEKRGDNLDFSRMKLEDSVKSLEENNEKEVKKYDDLLKKYTESKKLISKLKQDIKSSKNSSTFLEEKVKELEREITVLKAALEISKLERTEVEKDMEEKNKKMRELETEINFLNTSKTENNQNKKPIMDEKSLDLVNNLVKNVEKKNLQIQELKKKINRLEHMVREKSSREEKLLLHVTKLNKKCSNCCTSLNGEVKDLQDTAKDLQCQVSDLEKVLGQKTLELDQRDRVIKELKELIHLKNESDLAPSEVRKPSSTEKVTRVEKDNKPFSRHKKMIEMFTLLELKQMEIMKLERRIRGLQKFQCYERKTEKQIKTNDDATN